MLASAQKAIGVMLTIERDWGIITLCKPRTLNALSFDMVVAIRAFLTQCEQDSCVKGIVIKSTVPNMFSAGGDIKAVYMAYVAGEGDMLSDFLAHEYGLNLQIAMYTKPVVALMDGVTLGGGVGLSRYATHRIATPEAKIGMPEVKIAFFPDVGAGYFLNLLAPELSRFLALTGHLVQGVDALKLGYATHVISKEALANVELSIQQGAGLSEVSSCVGASNLEGLAPVIECFSEATLFDCVAKLQKCTHPEAPKFCNELQTFSPLALHIIWRYMHMTRGLSLDKVLRFDHTLAVNMLNGSDFMEGVRTRVVDKRDTPTWQHASIYDVTDTELNAYFEAL